MRASVQDIIKKVRQIELRTWRRTRHGLMGQYHSAMKGQGMIFSEIRPYQVGDEIRRIDWNRTARYQEPYVKVMEEERELTVLLAVDVSASMDYGTHAMLKNEYIAEVLASIGLSAAGNGDKVGLILYRDKVIDFLPPKKGRSHVLAMISRVLQADYQSGAASHEQFIRYLQNGFRKKSFIFWLSDFNELPLSRSIQVLSRQHQLLGIQILDQIDAEIPNIGFAKIRDVETGEEMWVNTSSKKNRNTFLTAKQNEREVLKNDFEKAGAGFISLTTSEDYLHALFQFFQKHRH